MEDSPRPGALFCAALHHQPRSFCRTVSSFLSFPSPRSLPFPLSHFCCLHPSHLPAPSPSLPPASQALSSLFTHTAPSPSPTPPPPLDAWAAGITHARKLLTLQLCDPSVNNTGLAAQSLLLLCGLQRPKSKTPLLPLPFGRLVPPPHPN